ncbi:MAG: chemotaxis protein CheB, partial [Pseudomonadota bacterium]
MSPLPFPIVGVGASAGGLDAFSKLVAKLPADFGGSIVFVTHLSPDRESNLVQILSVFSKLPVSEIAMGVRPERGRIYITPPQADVTFENGVFSLHPRPSRLLMHLPIDQFFVSIAEEMGPQAIGIILSGTGADGTAGLLAIKGRGGVTFVQSGDTAKFSEMPLNAGKAIGVADFVLPPEEIAGQLDHICRDPGFLDAKQDESFVFDQATLNELFNLLRREVGVDFSGYKSGTVGRRITRRMVFVRAKSLEDYVKFLRSNPEETKILFREILINVTSFFRDPELFMAMETVVFPALLKRHPEQGGLRIWVPGCATGEEAYSIAIS